MRRGREGSLALLLEDCALLLLACAGDFSSVEARSTFSSAMLPESSSTPGSDEGDASSASGDIITFSTIRLQHDHPYHTASCAQAQRASRPTLLQCVAVDAGSKRATRQAGIEPRGAGGMPGAGTGAGTRSRSRVPGAHKEALCDGLCSPNKSTVAEPASRAARQRCIPPR